MAFVIGILTVMRRWAQVFGPYLMLEILLPGGTLLALLLFLYRRRLAVQTASAATSNPLQRLEARLKR